MWTYLLGGYHSTHLHHPYPAPAQLSILLPNSIPTVLPNCASQQYFYLFLDPYPTLSTGSLFIATHWFCCLFSFSAQHWSPFPSHMSGVQASFQRTPFPPPSPAESGAFLLCSPCTVNMYLQRTEFSCLLSLCVCLCPPQIFLVKNMDSVIFDIPQLHTVPINNRHSTKGGIGVSESLTQDLFVLKIQLTTFKRYSLKPYSVLYNLAFGLQTSQCSASSSSILLMPAWFT